MRSLSDLLAHDRTVGVETTLSFRPHQTLKRIVDGMLPHPDLNDLVSAPTHGIL